MKLLGFFLVYAFVQTISVRWLLQRANPVWVRLATLIPALVVAPTILYLLSSPPVTIDPFAVFWFYLAIGAAIVGLISGTIWHFAAPWFETS